MRTKFDAIVVGSGMTGGWAAKELCEAGLEVALLEAGAPFDPASDSAEHVANHELPFRGLGSWKRIRAEQPIQSKSESFNEWNARFWVNDRENPYTHPEAKPFEFLRGRQVGGRSITWGRKVYRWSDLDFEANAKDGVGTPWPISYSDLAPWYDRVESFIGVSGAKEGLAHLPDGTFLPPMAMSCGERLMKKRSPHPLTIARVAMLTKDHGGRAACHYCGPCERGCVTRSYFSTPNATLPAALATGKLTLLTHSIARELLWKDGRARAVATVNALTKKETELSAKVFFLCASTLESTRLLLLSKLPDESGQLGRNLMDHLCAGGAEGAFPELSSFDDPGRRPAGIYVPRFRNLSPKDARTDYTRGFGLQGESRRLGLDRLFLRPRLTALPVPGIGQKLKDSLEKETRWTVSLSGFGECLPHADNRVTLDPEKRDAWGIPVVHVEMQWRANELALWRDMLASGAELLEACGAKDVRVFGGKSPGVPGHAIHEMGTARMGGDAKTSVLDRWNRAHAARNVFVTDGSCMASSGSVNPSLTYMALTARAAAHAVELLRKREP